MKYLVKDNFQYRLCCVSLDKAPQAIDS